MKLSTYIKTIKKEFNFMNIEELTIDVGLDTTMNINPKSLNRIKFTLKKK